MAKKKKTVWVDDGRTIADMSGIDHPRLSRSKYAPGSSAKDKWSTYWNAVRMMFVPMLVTMTAIGVIYLVIWLIMFLIA